MNDELGEDIKKYGSVLRIGPFKLKGIWANVGLAFLLAIPAMLPIIILTIL